MRSTKKVAGVVGAVLAFSLVAACSGTSSDNKGGGGGENPTETSHLSNGTLPDDGPAQDGGILRINSASDAPSIDPQKSASTYTHSAVAGIVYSKLVEFKTGRDIPYGSMELKGDLADDWSRSDDGLTWTFNLHKGVKWQNIAPVNGREFNSSDVACTIERIKSLPGVQKNLVDIVQTVETPDPYTVNFKLSSPYGAFDETMASFYMEILPCEGTRGEFDLAQQAIGTGPFILKDWKRKVQMTYVKNPDYFVAGKPHLDGVNLVIMADPASALAAVRTGELDATGSVNETLLPGLVNTNSDIVVQNLLTVGPNQIMFNQDRAPFNDYRVRKALLMAWDRDGMAKTFYTAWAWAGPIPSSLYGGMPSDEVKNMVPYDPEGAKKLLAEAGFPDGLTLKMLTTDGYGPQFVNQAQWLQQDLKEIGVNVELEIIDYATYFSTFGAKDYDLGWGLSTSFLTADEWLQALYTTDGPRNWFNTKDPKLDTMIDEQRAILDKDQRNDKLQEINKYIEENVLSPAMGFQFSSLLTTQTWVHNLYTHPAYQRTYLADAWLDSDAPTRK